MIITLHRLYEPFAAGTTLKRVSKSSRRRKPVALHRMVAMAIMALDRLQRASCQPGGSGWWCGVVRRVFLLPHHKAAEESVVPVATNYGPHMAI